MSEQIAGYQADRDAFGHLLVDHLDGKPGLQIIEREDGLLLSAGGSGRYFAEAAEWSPMEQEAMRWVVPGRALDLGCGAGRVAPLVAMSWAQAYTHGRRRPAAAGSGKENVMAATVEIGSLITRTPEIRGGRPRIAGTGVTVRRIVTWYQLGLTPEEIAREIPHLTLAQIHAALAYYHANREEIEADLAAEAAEAQRLQQASPASGTTP
jgi:uncharacterized protein (DUF433 family)